MMWKNTICPILLFIFLIQNIEAKHGAGKPDGPIPINGAKDGGGKPDGPNPHQGAKDGAGKPDRPNHSQPQRKWMTLHGDQPDILANGGYSGFFPDSSPSAYAFAADSSLPGTIMYCNLHFSKDNDGFCISQINLQNTTTIKDVDPKGEKTYNINGQDVHGWFGLDYPAKQLFETVKLIQNIFSRKDAFDGEPLFSPFDFEQDNKKPGRVWLNIEYDSFYKQQNISAEKYLFETLNDLPEFISSTEIGFLKSIGPKLGKAKTKLIFKLLGKDMTEPTSKEKYGSLINNLSEIKSFASGILVPKEYIWPTDKARILEPATSLVADAHKQGLAIYASGFANDNFLSYNYSYDPTKEYLQFVDNSQFSVDGVLTDFPSTASEAIGCLSPNKNATRVIKTSIISHNGASGDFPGATDLAYQKAIDDGADIIDCSVQMSKDGVAFCSDRPDLVKTTTAAALFMDRTRNVPEIQPTDGIFSFDLTWSEIQSLKPQIESTNEGGLVRNPANKNSGKFVTLPEFLELAKTKAVAGVLLFIQNAPYYASKAGLNIVDTVSGALKNATLDKQSNQKVLIQSDDSSVLSKFKDYPSYQKVLYLNSAISGAPDQVVKEVKKYADAVFVRRNAVVLDSEDFAFNFTTTIPALHSANISVYVGVLKNEFMNLIFDYLADPYVELATMNSLGVDGLVTDFPATASSFVRSSCTSKRSLYSIKPVEPGFLYKAAAVAQPPLLSTADVVDPPLPPVVGNTTDGKALNSTTPTPTSTSPTSAPAQGSSDSSTTLSSIVLLFAAMAGLLALTMV